MWVQPGIDRYLVCSSIAAGTIRQYDPAADVVELPAPVRPEFYAAPPRRLARDTLGLDAEAPCVLLLGGGWGRGPLDECAGALADAGYHVLVVAGTNRALERRLRATAAARRPGTPGRITVFGFVEEMPELMAAADIVVTSPGQTCHEARVVGRPLVLLDIVPGHGRENLLLELAEGGPVDNAADWQKQFIAAIDDLLPADLVRP
jgi:UDP-N-acetylglucosamine:LPS N-acetylglucosamine transferase